VAVSEGSAKLLFTLCRGLTADTGYSWMLGREDQFPHRAGAEHTVARCRRPARYPMALASNRTTMSRRQRSKLPAFARCSAKSLRNPIRLPLALECKLALLILALEGVVREMRQRRDKPLLKSILRGTHCAS
jgi:hypothetical protein